MTKSEFPTSRFQVFCDEFDVKLTAELHLVESKDDEAEKEIKLKITLENVHDSDQKLSVSLYQEDVEMLNNGIAMLGDFISERMEGESFADMLFRRSKDQID